MQNQKTGVASLRTLGGWGGVGRSPVGREPLLEVGGSENEWEVLS